jgi:hypothetical protein
MNIFVNILLGLGGFITLLLLIAAVMPKNLDIVKTVIIHKPKQQVFEYIKFVKNHDHFSAWAMMDPDMKKEYKGTDGTVGFVYAWDSAKEKNVGAGEQEIKNIFPGEGIEFELRFTRPMEDVAKAIMKLEAVSADQTKVNWSFHSKMKYPMNLMMPMIKGMLGKDLEKGTVNLKAVLEK